MSATLWSRSLARLWVGLVIVAVPLLLSGRVVWAQDSVRAKTPDSARAQTAADTGQKLPPDQLQSLVAPIALYPDELLAQTLVASTYPLEIMQLQQWLTKHPGLKDQALVDSVKKQPWDPAIQSMAAMPEVVKRLADDIQWTTDLGNAFLAQQSDVMNAVQVMRKKAKENGALESNEQQKVETKVVEDKDVIVVQSANPEVVYVPSYSPTVVYGAPVYPYPAIYYPPYTAGAAFVSFTFGMAWGAAMWGGSCCYAGWGGGNVYVNNNNYFNRNNNFNRGAGNRGNTWRHNPQHRGGAPYGDRRTADRYGGSARGDRASAANRGERAGGAGDRAGGAREAGGNRAGGGERAAAGERAGGGERANAGNRANGSDRVGNQEISRDAGGSRSGDRGSGFSDGSRSFDGGNARASSSRGASSMGSRGGGGGFRGGGGGGMRGGGGRGGGRR